MKFFLLLLFLVIKLAHASNKINFSGHQCQGDEAAVAKMNGKWADYTCPMKEWLIEIEGSSLFIGKLKLSSTKHSELYNYYNIIPTIPVGPEIRWILKQHWARVSSDGEILVVHK